MAGSDEVNRNECKGAVPIHTWVLISNFKLAYNMLRRADGTFDAVPGHPLLPRRQLRALVVRHGHLRQPVPAAGEAEQGRGGVGELPARPGAPVPVRVRRRVGGAQVGDVAAFPRQRLERGRPRVPVGGQLRRQHRPPRGRPRGRGRDPRARQRAAERHVRRRRAHGVGAAAGRQVLRDAPGQGLVLEGVPARGRRPGPPGVQPVRAQRTAPRGAALPQEPDHRVGPGPHLRPAAGLRRRPPGGRTPCEARVPREGHRGLLPAAQHEPLPRGHGGDSRLPQG
uniref:Uncharacterized protein n=1 Tax=Zea mays TaxID=4577 RepID=B4FJG3_MAIZE|nr:unknown [Zea mays]|eukprot:NP_001136607.1 uncharacterized LOC100216730 [Zea mays]